MQVILLDTRSFRSPLRPTDQRGAPGKERYLPDPDPAKTMLGEAQWAWLRAQLQQPAELRLIVSSIQVLAEGHGWERWGNLPRERERLFELIAATGAEGRGLPVGRPPRRRRSTARPRARRTGSTRSPRAASTCPIAGSARAPGRSASGAVYGATNFGTVDIDWWAGKVALCRCAR